jgi:hypothetical protein
MLRIGMEKCYAGSDSERCAGEREGKLAEMFYSEGLGEFGVVAGESDFFEGFATGYFEGSFF